MSKVDAVTFCLNISVVYVRKTEDQRLGFTRTEFTASINVVRSAIWPKFIFFIAVTTAPKCSRNILITSQSSSSSHRQECLSWLGWSICHPLQRSSTTLLSLKFLSSLHKSFALCKSPLTMLTLTLKWPGGGGFLGTQDLFFAHFTTFASAFFTVIFSNCLSDTLLLTQKNIKSTLSFSR